MGLQPISEFDNEKMFVYRVDLDCDEPYLMAYYKPEYAPDGRLPSFDDEEIYFSIPSELAYYLRTHFCGSKKMHENLLEDGRAEIRSKIKKILKI